MGTRVGVYARLSRDSDGTQTATARQIEACRQHAAARGWDVADVYEDVDLSAFRDVVRPEYERMLDDVSAGRLDVVLVWKLDRLVRSPREFERFWKVCEDAGATLAAVLDPVETSSEIGMIVVRMLVGFARLESANISIRTKAAQEQRANAGRPHGGGRRPYGLTEDRTGIVEDEAANIREAADRLLAGESEGAVATDWQRRGIRSPGAVYFSRSTLRSMLLSPRIAGQRQHLGVIAGAGAIPAILDPTTHARLVSLLTAPGRRPALRGNHYLLAGLVRCGQCGSKMLTHALRSDFRRYRCVRGPQLPGCGRTFIKAAWVEDYVVALVLEALDGPDLEAALRARAERASSASEVEQLRADEDNLAQLARDHYVDRVIGRAEFLAARNSLEARIEARRRALAARAGDSTLRAVAGSARRLWPELPMDRRRAILASVLEAVVIGPGRRGYNRFDPARVSLTWRA